MTLHEQFRWKLFKAARYCIALSYSKVTICRSSMLPCTLTLRTGDHHNWLGRANLAEFNPGYNTCRRFMILLYKPFLAITLAEDLWSFCKPFLTVALAKDLWSFCKPFLTVALAGDQCAGGGSVIYLYSPEIFVTLFLTLAPRIAKKSLAVTVL